MHNKILTAVVVALLFFLLGLRAEEFLASQEEPVMPCEKVLAEISVYNACILSASKVGCIMQVDDFRKYRQLLAEKDKRCGATPCLRGYRSRPAPAL